MASVLALIQIDRYAADAMSPLGIMLLATSIPWPGCNRPHRDESLVYDGSLQFLDL